MKFLKYIKKKMVNIHLLYIGIIIFIGIFTFNSIHLIFFQQDEWLGLGGAISRQESGGVMKALQDIATSFTSTRFLPLTSFTNYIVYNVIGLNTGLYGVLGLLFALINAILLYFISYLLTKSKLVGLFVAGLWITNNLVFQSIAWIATMIPSQLALLFFLISFLLLLLYVKRLDKKYLIGSLITISASILFKEIGMFYIIVYSWFLFFLTKNSFNFKKKILLIGLFIIPLVVVAVLPRAYTLTQSNKSIAPVAESTSTENILYNALLIPSRSLFHVYIPPTKLYEFIYAANKIHYSGQIDGFVVESIIADSFSLIGAFYILFIVCLIAVMADDFSKRRIIFFLLAFFASTLPFILFRNQAAILEPRFFLFPAVWASLLMVYSVYVVFSKFPLLRPLCMIVIFVPLVVYYSNGAKAMLQKDIEIGEYRKNILQTVSLIKPDLQENTVFYFFTDNNGFYEFQSGFGQTLGVWLYDTNKIPKGVLMDEDFWNPYYEGIKEYDGQKYGYYMFYDKLIAGLKKNSDIKVENIHAYYWDLQKHTVKNVSKEVREKIKKDLTL